MSSYTGLCTIDYGAGGLEVKVQDTGGNEIQLPAEEYERRGIHPPLSTLKPCPGTEKRSR